MKKIILTFSLILTLCAGIFFTLAKPQVSASAAETDLPDTSTWTEVDAVVGEKVAGNWYRFYYEDIATNYFTIDNIFGFWSMLNVQSLRLESNSGPSYYTNIQIIVGEGYKDIYLGAGQYKYGIYPESLTMGPVEITTDSTITCIFAENSPLKRLVEPETETETPETESAEPESAEPEDDSMIQIEIIESTDEQFFDKANDWVNEKLGLGLSASMFGTLLIVLVFILFFKRK